MKEDSVLSFKWQSFPTHMMTSLDVYYEKQQFVDLSLVCKDGTILKCHKMVLANSSFFFRRLLLANDHPHPMIVLHDIEADDLKTLVNFMYCGEIQVVQSEVRRLLKLAEILEVIGLRHIPPSSVPDGSNNKEHYDSTKKTTTVSRVKLEESRNASSKNVTSEPEASTKTQQGKVATQTRFVPKMNPYKATTKVSQETSKNEEINISELCQRLETSNSGISIIDINEPSTSRGVRRTSPMQQCSRKRKEFSTPEISWPTVLSTIASKPLSFQKVRCIMDEVEITPGKPSTSVSDNKINDPLDRRKHKKNSSEDNNLNMVYIKDEIEISSDVEEDVDMDPLEVDEIDNENSKESSKAPQQFYSQMFVHTLNKNTHPHTEFSPRRDSNG